jgi:uncharacterized protein YqhQ
MEKRFNYGGQAVMEGVMIRGRRFMSLAVRRRNGEIQTVCEPLDSLYTGSLRRMPLLRGVIVLVETMVLGYKALERSARMALQDAAEEEGEPPKWLMVAAMLFALVLAIGLFIVIPLFATRSADNYIASDVLSNLIEGVIRLAILVAYLWAISLIPEVRRVFAYHGAEHKAVNAYEHGVPMESEQVKAYSTAHARCGTAFLLVVMVVAILAFAFLGRPPLAWRLLSRIALIPVVAAVSYEVIRFSGAHSGNWLVRTLLSPSLWLQKLSTRKPDDRQVEVAVHAMRAAVAADNGEPLPASVAPATESVLATSSATPAPATPPADAPPTPPAAPEGDTAGLPPRA